MGTTGEAGAKSVPPVDVSAQVPSSIHYTFSHADRFRALLAMTFRNRVLIGLFALILFRQVWRAWGETEGAPGSVRAVAVLLALLFMMVLFTVVPTLTSLALVYLSTDRSVVGPITLYLQDDGLLEENPVTRTVTRWAGLYQAIPHRAFSTQAERAAFVVALRERIAAARQRGPG
jgi:hypothetical protein